MKLGVAYPVTELGGDPDAFLRFGIAIEELGYDHLLLYDHIVGAVHEGRIPPLPGGTTRRIPSTSRSSHSPHSRP